MDESVRLARMEAKLDSIMDCIEKMDAASDRLSVRLDATRDKVNDLDSRAKGAWFVIGIFSAAVSFLVSFFKG